MTFPTTAVLDDFDRDDEGPPPSASWTSQAGEDGLLVLSDQCAGEDSNNDCFAWWNTEYGSSSEVYVTLDTLPEDGLSAILFARFDSQDTDGSGYRLVYNREDEDSPDIFAVERIDAGDETELLSIEQDINTGDSIGLEIVGSTLTVYHKPGSGSWTSLGSATDSTYADAGYIGLMLGGSAARGDDFGGGTACVEVTSATITGDKCATIDVSEEYTVAADQSWSVLTSWTWSSDGLQSGQGTATAVYEWSTPGSKTVTCTVSNACSDDVVATKAVLVSAGSIRADIYAIVNAISTPDPGQVHDYKRWAVLYDDFLSKFKTTISGENFVRGCEVECGTFTTERLQFHETGQAGTIRDWTFYVHAYLTWNDSDESEKTAEALAEAIGNALDDSDVLHTSCFYYYAHEAQLVNYEPRLFGNILVHYIRIQQNVTEYLE